jgi:prepilin-type N-terminal cleavage/methylation domain-containing protein
LHAAGVQAFPPCGSGGFSGFTLIELLLVVAILSAVTMAAFTFAIDDRAQARFEDTRNRLLILRRAILGVETPAYGGEMRLSGYVADNGRLPETLSELAATPADTAGTPAFMTKQSVAPFYAQYYSTLPADADECAQDGRGSDSGSDKTDLPSFPLLKGHRGNYLNGLTRNHEFRDGWGNEGKDADNDFGWQVTLATNTTTGDQSFEITSLGADNTEGQSEGENAEAEADQSMKIEAADWRIPLAGWQVTVRNRRVTTTTTGDSPPVISTSPATIPKLSAALLVFRNSGANGEWLRYETPQTDCAEAVCFLTFTTTPDCGGNKSVPLGRHLLALLKDGKIARMKDGKTVNEYDACSESSDPDACKSDFNESPLVAAQALFYPHAERPDITLEIR